MNDTKNKFLEKFGYVFMSFEEYFLQNVLSYRNTRLRSKWLWISEQFKPAYFNGHVDKQTRGEMTIRLRAPVQLRPRTYLALPRVHGGADTMP